MSVATKYHKVVGYQKYEDIPLNRENMWFVQLDASIRSAFLKFGFQEPSDVFINAKDSTTKITIVRSAMEDSVKWYNDRHLIMEELNIQADANKTDKMRYVFKII